MFNKVCLAKNVFVNPTRSVIGLLLASAHQLVYSKLFDVFRRLLFPDASARCWSRTVLE